MKKSRIIPIILTLVVWFVMFYVALPPLNFQAQEFWTFLVAAAVVAVVLNMWTIVVETLQRHQNRGAEPVEKPKKSSPLKKAVVVILAFVAVYLVGNLLSSPILRAGAYSELLPITQGTFSEDIDEADFSRIPLLDKDSAARLAEREMGSMVDMVSQFEVSDYYTQINYKARPTRVTPLEYGNWIKWITNRSEGIPAYISIDMTTQDVELVRLEQGIKISPSEYFGRDLIRYLRFRYPTAMFRSINFEIDDNGTPYWIGAVAEHTIGLFGGTDIKGAVLLNAVTGEHTYYDVETVPQWVDKVYDAELLIQQYNYYGNLRNGFLNSVLGQRECLQTTQGYNYIAQDDDVWVYTGITSVLGDQSNVGFILLNQRTKEANYYAIPGAEEFSAMSSAEGQVQHLGYTATFPLLLNVGGEPTYFLALKDGAGLVKKYAMVNIQKYQIVATGDSVSETEKAYRNLMQSSGYSTVDPNKTETITGTIAVLQDVVIDGNTIFYVMLEGKDTLYAVPVQNDLNLLRKAVGDSVTLEYTESTDDVATVLSVK